MYETKSSYFIIAFAIFVRGPVAIISSLPQSFAKSYKKSSGLASDK